VQTQHDVNSGSLEEAGYFPVSGAHLYTVLHRVAEPLARVLLVGPFASERHYSYVPWVQWARYLAARGIECLRYDYRGIGESTGAFEEMGFDSWIEDVELLSGWLRTRQPDLPLLLHGLELGAVLAGKAFEAGSGDALLLWAAPQSANQSLRSTLLRRISLDNAFKFGDERSPMSSYFGKLDNGDSLEVEGYKWTARLWQDSMRFELPSEMIDENPGTSAQARPIRSVKLDKNAVPLIKGSSVGYEGISKDFGGLFGDNLEWIKSVVVRNGGISESGH
jgi:hypothetical protein